MKQWYQEDWEFTVKVEKVGRDNKPTNYRMGYEPGDSFTYRYGCPEHFCSKSMLKLFLILEAVRSGGDLRNLGGADKHEMAIVCPDGVVQFRISGKQLFKWRVRC